MFWKWKGFFLLTKECHFCRLIIGQTRKEVLSAEKSVSKDQYSVGGGCYVRTFEVGRFPISRTMTSWESDVF